MRFTYFFYFVLFLLNLNHIFANEKYSEVRIIHENSILERDKGYIFGIKINLKPGWKTYWKNPGDSGSEPQILHNSNDKYFKSPLFHMEHPRTDQSTIMHKYFQSNELLMHCIDNMSQDDFIQYIYENSNSELDINQYKKIISNISSLTNT